MKYHENYDLEMTPSEANYHQMLECREQLVKFVQEIHCDFHLIQKYLDLSTDKLKELFKCEIVDDELVFQFRCKGYFFEHSPESHAIVNLLSFSHCKSYFLNNNLFNNKKIDNVNYYFSKMLTLEQIYAEYLLAYDAI